MQENQGSPCDHGRSGDTPFFIVTDFEQCICGSP